MAIPIPAHDFARFDRLSFVPRAPARAGLGGEHPGRRHAPSADFAAFRPYGPGDDLRRVDWNVFARLNSLQVKLTHAPERQALALVLDASASMDFGYPGKLAFAAQALAALAYVGLARADAVRLLRLGDGAALGPLHGRACFGQVLRFLQATAPTGRVDLANRLPDLPRGTLAVLVSDLLAPGDALPAALDAWLAAGVEPVVLQVLSPQEAQPDLLGEVDLEDAESGEHLEVGLSLAALDQYRERYARWLERQAATCATRGVRHVRARSDRPLPFLLLRDLREAGVLR